MYNATCVEVGILQLVPLDSVHIQLLKQQHSRISVPATIWVAEQSDCVQDTVIEEDKEFVTQYFDMPDTDFADMERMSPWLLRIELNREMLTDKGLNMSRIADTITSEFGDEMSVIFTDDNAPKHILRVGLASAWLWHGNASAHMQDIAQAQTCSTICKSMIQSKGFVL